MLGGSSQQVVAIEAAKRLGYRTILCDYLPDNPGQYVADVFYQESSTDADAVLEIAKKEQVDGILAYASDPASPIAAYVAGCLGLPTNPLAAVETMSQKHLFRQHLKDEGFPHPQSHAFAIDEDPEEVWRSIQNFAHPIVVKPTDSSGSKGVSIVSEREEFMHAVGTASRIGRNGTLIAEEYIEMGYPYVIGGDIFVIDGKIRFWGLMDCVRDASVSLVPTGKKAPTGLSDEHLTEVKAQLERLVSTLDVRFGELNVEVILGKDSTPYIIELGSRAGGNMIPVQLSDMSGIDLVEANVLCAMGEAPEKIDFDTSQQAYATHVLHTFQSGIYKAIEIDDELSSHVYRTVLYAKKGDPIGPFDGANKAVGIVFMKFDSLQQMNAKMSRINDHIHVVVDETELEGTK